ncbi:MAG: S8 family serine peptidase [Candidatus Nanosalina sp.]
MRDKFHLIFTVLILFSHTGFSEPVYLKSGKVNLSDVGSPGLKSMDQYNSETNLLVQFNSTTSRDFREDIRDVQFHKYFPENTWLVRSNLSRNEVESLEKVETVAPYLSSFKKPSSLDLSKIDELKVSTLGKVSRKKIEKFGDVLERKGEKSWRIKINGSKAAKLLSQSFVVAVGKPSPPLTTFNLESRQLVNADKVLERPYNLSGAGFTAAVWDRGWAGKHVDLNQTGKRIVGDQGKACGECKVLEHGTHVAGTLLGSGIKENNLKGVAPESRLITYEWPGYDSTGSYNVSSIQETENEINESINDYSTVVSQNSWGYSKGSGDYFGLTGVYDSIVAGGNPDVSGSVNVVFSAGNIRNQVSREYNTTMPPATAKNVIAVGAVDDSGDMTSYSSWGPTDDGRIKPDLVADGGDCGSGTSINSTVPGNSYKELCGTSMAAPAVAGGIVLVNQQFNRTYGRKPDPATVKGILLHTAKDLFTEGPDYRTGWGLLNIKKAVEFTERSRKENLVRKNSLATGENNTYYIERSKNSNLKFTLVWSDPRSSTGTKTLVNDLDLTVRNKEGEKFYPSTMNWSTRGEGAYRGQDHVNNVEQVIVKNSNSTAFNITVEGESVPKNPQDYSLIINRYVDNTEPNANIISPSQGNYSGTINISATWNDSLTTVKNASVTAGNSSNITKTLNTTLNTSLLQDGSQILEFRFTDEAGNTKIINRTIIVDNTAPTINLSLPLYISENITFKPEVTDKTTYVAKSSLKIQNSSFSILKELNSTLHTENLSDGEYTAIFNYSDALGNTGRTSVNFSVDNTYPELVIESPIESPVKENLSIEYLANDRNLKKSSVMLSNESTTLLKSSNELKLNSTNLTEGNYSINISAIDLAGNTFSRIFNFTYRPRPQIEVIKPSEEYYGKPPDFNISTEADIDNALISTVDENISTAETRSYFVNTSFRSRNGSNNITIFLEENNLTWRKKLDYFVDVNAPDFSIEEPGKYENTSSELKISLTNISDSTGFYSLNVSLENHSKNASTSSLKLDTSNITEGPHNLTLYVKDRFSNFAKRSRKIIIDRTAPSLESYLGNDSLKSENFDLNASSVDELSGVLNLSYTLKSEKFTSSGPLNASLNVSRIPDGEYLLNITSIDRAGNLNTSLKNITIDTAAPRVSEVSPPPGIIGQDTVINITVNELTNLSNRSSAEISSGNTEINISKENMLTDFSGLYSGDTFEIRFELIDPAGNSDNITYSYSIREEESDSSGISSGSSDSSGSPIQSFSQPVNKKNKSGKSPENTTEETNQSNKSIKGKQRVQILDLKAGSSSQTVSESSPVQRIRVKSSESVSVSISEVEENLSSPQNTRKLEKFNLSMNSSEAEVNLTFKVSRNKINRSQVDSVRLYRRENSKWESLETTYLNSTNSSFNFRSQIPGFSPFVVALSQEGEKNTSVAKENKSSKEQTLNIKKEIHTPPILSIFAVLWILLLIYMVARRRKKMKVESELNNIRKNMEDSPEKKHQLINSELEARQGKIEKALQELGDLREKIRKEKYSGTGDLDKDDNKDE